MDRNSKKDFLSFANKVNRHSFSQRLQDLWFLWETGFKPNGTFIEFGALNGRDFSNTYLLENFGWTGIVAEPHPDFEEKIRTNRNCEISTKCVYSKTGETVVFNVVKGRPALSAIGHLALKDERENLRSNFTTIEVETISLNSLVENSQISGTVDCLSIDTEGSEEEILKAYDFERRPINCICVEHNHVAREKLNILLTSVGYDRKFEDISGHDDWYVLSGAYPDWPAQEIDLAITKLKKLPTFERGDPQLVRKLMEELV